MVKQIQFVRVFRFIFIINGLEFGTTDARWECDSLIVRRGMEVGAKSLFDTLSSYNEVMPEVTVHMFDASGTVTYAWRLTYEKLIDRGFDFLDAQQNSVAHEAVCFLNAQLKRIS